MNFTEYVGLVAESVADTGYDRFMPSMCRVGDAIALDVLVIDCSPNGDEKAAKEWAEKAIDPDGVMYLAYRIENRIVEVIEITGYEVTKKHHLECQP